MFTGLYTASHTPMAISSENSWSLVYSLFGRAEKRNPAASSVRYYRYYWIFCICAYRAACNASSFSGSTHHVSKKPSAYFGLISGLENLFQYAIRYLLEYQFGTT